MSSPVTHLQPPDVSSAETLPVFSRWFGSWRLSLERRALSRPQLAEVYDHAAARWDAGLARLGTATAYCGLLRDLHAQGALVPAAAPAWPRVLDAGIGTGALSLSLARLLGGRVRLDGIDISPRMLFEARHAFAKEGLGVALRLGDLRDLPYEDESFDVVMLGHVVEHLPNPQAALAEVRRVLRPGGRVLVCITRRSLAGLGIQLRWRTHRVSEEQMTSWLRQAGFTEARCIATKRRTAFSRLSIACVATRP